MTDGAAARLGAGAAEQQFDEAIGDLLGCEPGPVRPGATGNLATEDLVSMVHETAIETGIDLPVLLEASAAVREVLGRPLRSHTLIAGPADWHDGG
jgi:hydroxymethylglutaryl-CoA lyase